MNEQQALSKMIAPGTPRPGKYRQGVIQIWVTRACDKACFGCTQGSNLAGPLHFMPPALFEQAVLSLKGYWGVVGVFGGNPALHPTFDTLCEILRKYIPFEQRGLWCNNPMGKGRIMRNTFYPAVSNLNVHLDHKAYDEFKRDWPECHPVGLHTDSRHSPPFVAMKDVIEDEDTRWDLIADCDINKHWSAMIGLFRGQLRAWFCEIAGAQSILHQDEPDYPDTGLDPVEHQLLGRQWWEAPMVFFSEQVRKHCHECGIPLRGYGELAQSTAPSSKEQTSQTHYLRYRTKRTGRPVEMVTQLQQLEMGRLSRMTDYIKNATK